MAVLCGRHSCSTPRTTPLPACEATDRNMTIPVWIGNRNPESAGTTPMVGERRAARTARGPHRAGRSRHRSGEGAREDDAIAVWVDQRQDPGRCRVLRSVVRDADRFQARGEGVKIGLVEHHR